MQKRLRIWGSNCWSEVAAFSHTVHCLIYRSIHLLAEPAGDARHLETTRPGFKASRAVASHNPGQKAQCRSSQTSPGCTVPKKSRAMPQQDLGVEASGAGAPSLGQQGAGWADLWT